MYSTFAVAVKWDQHRTRQVNIVNECIISSAAAAAAAAAAAMDSWHLVSSVALALHVLPPHALAANSQGHSRVGEQPMRSPQA